jgi:hypothetical protein
MRSYHSDKGGLIDGPSFRTADYYEAIESGELGKMDFYCANEQEVNRLRNRVLTAARGQGHILHTSRTEVMSLKGTYFILSVSYLGDLPHPAYVPK